MSDLDIVARLDNIDINGAYEHYKPLSEAADEFIRFAQNPGARVRTGIEIIDKATRGVAPGEIMVIGGFAHSGKTVLATELIMNNADVPMVLFTPDETRPMVLTKLASAELGLNAEEIERRIYRDDAGMRDDLIAVAEKYERLAVYDQSVSSGKLRAMFMDAAEAFGERPKAVIFDYVEQLADPIDVKAKIDVLKAWGKDNGVPLFLLHQNSRSHGGPGQEGTLTSVAYGGEQQATFLVTVRRKKYMYLQAISDLRQARDKATNPTMIQRYDERIHDIENYLIPAHKDTISIGMPKNKRPPAQPVPETDFRLDPEIGRITLIHKDDPDELPDVSVENGVVIGGGSATAYLRDRRGS